MMKTTTITLSNSTGYKPADRVIQEIVAGFESTFPSRIIGYYVEGSYADGTAIPASDLDILIVFGGGFAHGEEKSATGLITKLEADSPIDLDIELTDEPTLYQNANPMFKLGSQTVYGTDIRDSIPLMPIEQWARQRMHAAYWLMINVFDRPKPVRSPIDFPNPDASYYGYANRTMSLADGQEIPTTRNLIRVTGWIATARLAHEAQEYVVRKRECYQTYQQAIGDDWTLLLKQIDERCRTDWHYRIPNTNAEQQELRDILTQTLAYENYFLGLYRQFLLAELTSGLAYAQIDALNFLAETVYADTAVTQTIHKLAASPNTAVRTAAEKCIVISQKGTF